MTSTRLPDLDTDSILYMSEWLSAASLAHLICTGSSLLRSKITNSHCVRKLHVLDKDDNRQLYNILHNAALGASFQRVTCIKVDRLAQGLSSPALPLQLTLLPRSLTKLCMPSHTLYVSDCSSLVFSNLQSIDVQQIVAGKKDACVRSMLPNMTALTLAHNTHELGVDVSLLSDDLTKIAVCGNIWLDATLSHSGETRVWTSLHSLAIAGYPRLGSLMTKSGAWPNGVTCPSLTKLALSKIYADGCNAIRSICTLSKLVHLKLGFGSLKFAFPSESLDALEAQRLPSSLTHLEIECSRTFQNYADHIPFPLRPLLPSFLQYLVVDGCISSDLANIVASGRVAHLISDSLLSETVVVKGLNGEVQHDSLFNAFREIVTDGASARLEKFQLVQTPRRFRNVLSSDKSDVLNEALLYHPSIGYHMAKCVPECVPFLRFIPFCNWLAHATTPCSRDIALLCQWAAIVSHAGCLSVNTSEALSAIENAIRMQSEHTHPTMFRALLCFIFFGFTDPRVKSDGDRYSRAQVVEYILATYSSVLPAGCASASPFTERLIRTCMKTICGRILFDDARLLMAALDDIEALDLACCDKTKSALVDKYPVYRIGRILAERLESACQLNARRDVRAAANKDFALDFVLPDGLILCVYEKANKKTDIYPKDVPHVADEVCQLMQSARNAQPECASSVP